MKKKNMRLLSRAVAALLAMILIVSNAPLYAHAETDTDPVIVVSLGDSYSSGEGIEPFYGQEKEVSDKVGDKDWLAHRSKKSWPSLLKIPDIDGTLGNYRSDYGIVSEECEWYFGAVSGAETKHFNTEQQEKKYIKDLGILASTPIFTSGTVYMPYQIDIFSNNNLYGKVDYVTLSVGGNDVKFKDIVTTCATNCVYLHWGETAKLEDTFANLWKSFDIPDSDDDTRGHIKQTYQDVRDAAGTQADIIVAGYPKLLDKNGKGLVINKTEATLVNQNVTKFNNRLKEIVNECREEGMNIHFVDVETEFDKDGGHQAYSEDAWINKIYLGPEDEELDEYTIASAYSIHPNEEGAKAYARCVNAKIQEIEDSKKMGTLSGKICKASDRTTPVTEASVAVISDRKTTAFFPDANGNYSVSLTEDEYLVRITAPGYIDFEAYAAVTRDQNTYMETFLLVEGSEDESGTASGTIRNALTGAGIAGVTLEVRSGWNNADSGEILTTITTDASGNYSVDLPLGNYTLNATKEGYISTMVNIIVQSGATASQNGAMTPVISGDSFRIVLTWGSSPSDLDSHMVGTLSSGSSFHVYYSHKSEYDGEVEVCNLDVDDTSSYGPETITLNTTTDNPYYYYIYNYSSTTGMITSEAQIKVYQGDTLVATFNVPTNQADARYWNVFAIVDGEMVVSNTVTSSADLSYANTTSQMRQMPINVDASMEANPKVVTDSE